MEEPNVSLPDEVLGDGRRSVTCTCILLPSHDSSPPASSLNMNYSRSRVTRRQSEWKGGEVSVARENICEEGRWGRGKSAATLGDQRGPDVAKTPDDTSASTAAIDGFLMLTER